MKFCGPKLSLCCTLLSIWGIIQLGLMGIFCYIKSPAFLEDLYMPEIPEGNFNAYIDAMETSFSQTATNCWIATGLYAATFLVSGWQMWLNFKT